MKKVVFFFLVLLLLPVFDVMAQTTQKDSIILKDARSAIDAGNRQWIESYEKSNTQGIVSLFAADGFMLGSKGRVSRGSEVISERIKANMKYFGAKVKVTVKTLNLWVVDLTAYETGEYSYTSIQEGKETVDAGFYTTIWKKQKDGSWKIFADMGVN